MELTIQTGGFEGDQLASEASFLAQPGAEEQEEAEDGFFEQLQALVYDPPQVSLDQWEELNVPATLAILRTSPTHSRLASDHHHGT